MGVHQPLRPVLCRFRGAVADNRAPLANGRPKVGPLFSADEMVAMKKQLQGKDVESSSKNRAQFSDFIVGKLQDRAREQGRNPMAVKAPNEKNLLGLRQDLLPDKRSKVVSKAKRRLHVLGDYLTQTSLVGALGAALHGHMPETGEEARVLAALFLNTDGTGIELAGDEKQDIYMAAGSDEILRSLKRSPAAERSPEVDVALSRQRRMMHFMVTGAADGEVVTTTMLVKDRNFNQLVLERVRFDCVNHALISANAHAVGAGIIHLLRPPVPGHRRPHCL